MNIDIPKIRGKAIWLASYPKSGNTWFRSFLSSLFSGSVDINRINTDGIFSGKQVVKNIWDIDPNLLTDEEVKVALPYIYNYRVTSRPDTSFIKVHDAYIYNKENNPIIPTESSHLVIYLMRNPLDVVGSLANHNNSTIDNTIKLMCNENGTLAKQNKGLNLNNQFIQLMKSWSGHVESWVDQPNIPVHVLRYEDMVKQPLMTFKGAIQAMGIEYKDEQIQEALDKVAFEKLKKAEEKDGFKEKNMKSKVFFRKGTIENWKTELNDNQIRVIKAKHAKVMKRFDYI